MISGGGNPPIAWNINIVQIVNIACDINIIIVVNIANIVKIVNIACNINIINIVKIVNNQFVCEYLLPFVGLGCTIYFVGLYYVSCLSMKVI